MRLCVEYFFSGNNYREINWISCRLSIGLWEFVRIARYYTFKKLGRQTSTEYFIVCTVIFIVHYWATRRHSDFLIGSFTSMRLQLITHYYKTIALLRFTNACCFERTYAYTTLTIYRNHPFKCYFTCLSALFLKLNAAVFESTHKIAWRKV